MKKTLAMIMALCLMLTARIPGKGCGRAVLLGYRMQNGQDR